ncbi:hypothetical protein [Actinospica robiniae]|uniref:hypothetical protein n=1 Tax=Actinospica robiniae TaxID=304901 RepID=UPI000423CFD7|nr:hypothetical protein [Actinospica robiniae]
MDARLRKKIADRDAALSRTGRVTRRIAALSAAGSLVLVAGFGHLIPTDFSHSSQSGGGGTSGGGSGTGNGNSNGNSNSTHGTPSPGHGSGPSHATSGGS